MKPVQRVSLVGAVACAILALVPGYYAVTLRWAPHADFDVVGILWLLQNLPRLVAWVLTAALGAAAFYLGVRAAH